jgi:hypothetical protein
MRELLITHKDIVAKLNEIELKVSGHDDKITMIFDYLIQLENDKQQDEEQKNRKRIGFRQDD